MPIFEQIRERLPSLYRPGDDDTHGEPIPLLPSDVLELNGAPLPPGSLVEAAGAVRVTLPEPVRVEELRVGPRVVRGSWLNLELYRVAGGVALPVPGAVARLERGLARPAARFEERRFAIRVRRPDLLSLVMWATARLLERVQVESTEVMRAHWLDVADRARFDPFFARSRELRGDAAPAPDDPELLLFPYIHDLARIGSLLALLPWREPAAHRERVEDYRLRLRRTVGMYRNGLGTVGALRRITQAQLPIDLGAPAGLRDRPFTIEEAPQVRVSEEAAQTRGAPAGMVGPLMRWAVESDGRTAAAPTVVIQGVTPEEGEIDATSKPLLELFSAGGARARIGIAYDGDLGQDQALRLRPTHASWLGGGDGVRHAASRPSAAAPADPTAPGPWQDLPGGPHASVTALLQTRDHTLWLATDEPAGALHRFDGALWVEALTGLPPVHALAEDGNHLLLATATGVRRMALYPDEGEPFVLEPAPDAPAVAAHALLEASDGAWYVGTATGLARLAGGDALAPFVLGADASTEVPVYAIHQDTTGTLHVGTERGLFRFQPGLGHWYWYRGGDRSDQHPDWVRYRPEGEDPERHFPAATEPFLPPVRAVHRGPDASLWIGTDRGIARYLAAPVRGLTYTTLLEAHPDLTGGRVYAIRQDERGALWFATASGLFRFDGRDWWQLQGDALVRLPTPEPTRPRPWRFHRALDRWEAFDDRSGVWTAPTVEPRAADEAGVRALLWTDGVAADLGSWNGGAFVPTEDAGAGPASLRMRYKPTETRIVAGGIPAVPRVPGGASVWRYLALEPEAMEAPASTPAWTVEGRLLPADAERESVLEGRHGAVAPLDFSPFDDAAFAFNPAARVWLSWRTHRPLAVLVRLRTLGAGESIDPAVLDRVWQGIQEVRPAGVQAVLAVEEDVVRSSRA
jgi:hypothetical protein